MKKVTYFFLVSFLFSSALIAQDVNELKEQIQKLNKIYSQAMIENNIDKMLSYYSEDVISMPSYQPTIKGLDALRTLSEEQINSGWKTNSFNLKTSDVIVSGNLAIEIGNYDMTMIGPNAEEWADNGKYLTVWEILDNGDMRIKIETWNTDNNPWMDMNQTDENQEMENPEMQ